jgi:hypothetical protein
MSATQSTIISPYSNNLNDLQRLLLFETASIQFKTLKWSPRLHLRTTPFSIATTHGAISTSRRTGSAGSVSVALHTEAYKSELPVHAEVDSWSITFSKLGPIITINLPPTTMHESRKAAMGGPQETAIIMT